MQHSRKKAIELGLVDLKIVAAEFSFDGMRLTLLYSSEENDSKLDLRGLRRVIQRVYPRTQVELHPIGPRDVAKMLGGMGACGMEERCCSAFLLDFSPISIKMAKEQGISLTPTEITGMCGRLRCCLVYEHEQYSEARKQLPKRNKRVITPNGVGKVIDILPLKGSVVVELDNGVRHEFVGQEVKLADDLAAQPQPVDDILVEPITMEDEIVSVPVVPVIEPEHAEPFDRIQPKPKPAKAIPSKGNFLPGQKKSTSGKPKPSSRPVNPHNPPGQSKSPAEQTKSSYQQRRHHGRKSST
jgi:cell fate regulator YaaT (PSP1 superfamily)